MSRSLRTIPAHDGFFMPAEWTEHQQTWMIWPERTDNWRLGAKPAQDAFLKVITAIAGFEPVSVCVSSKQYHHAAERLKQYDTRFPIRIVEMTTNDAWCRDTGPTFLQDSSGQVRGVDWMFNAWGGLESGIYFPWDADDQVARKILEIERVDRYRTDGFVLEGGSIHVDGDGTLLTTEECLLNTNRNPHLQRPIIERVLREYLGVESIIWLGQGIYQDETDGHIDNICCFAKPGVVLLAWTDDANDPQFERSNDAFERLSRAKDARGRSLEIHKLPLPQPQSLTKDDCKSIDHSYSCMPRRPGMRLAASYVNFYLCNGGLLMPTFDDPQDVIAAEILHNLFPDRKVVTVPGREILLGGGNIHCITQQQPR